MGIGAIKVALAMSALWLSGCGTVHNLCGEAGRFGDGEKKVYGGVASSAEYVIYFASGITSIDDLNGLAGWVLGTGYSVFVNMPLSAIGDTLTLPWTVSAT